MARSRVPHESRLILGGNSWRASYHSRAPNERPLAGAVSFHGARTDHDQRGTARARSKLACCASSRETASAVARSRVPRESRLILGGRSWHDAPRPRAEGERPIAGAVDLPSAWNDHNKRDTARAHSKLAYCASFRETASTVARSRVPREGQLIMGGGSWHVAPRPRAEEKRLLAGVVLFHGA